MNAKTSTLLVSSAVLSVLVFVSNTSKAIQYTLNPDDANLPWKTDWSQLPNANTPPVNHALSPALCAGHEDLQFTVSASPDPSGNWDYWILQWNSVNMSQVWLQWGGVYKSSPVCAMRENDASGKDGFLVAGLGTDSRLYATEGVMAPVVAALGNPPAIQPNPTYVSIALVGATTYGTGPAIASWLNSSGGGHLALVAMEGNMTTIDGYAQSLPYNPNSWLLSVGPSLPTGWAATAAPAIVEESTSGTFDVVVNAQNTALGSTAIFHTYFYTQAAGTFFDSGGWTELEFRRGSHGFPLTFIGSPSISYGTNWQLPTIWVLASVLPGEDNIIFQTTNPGSPGPYPIQAVRPEDVIPFSGAPSAFENVPFDTSDHIVIARVGSQIYFETSEPDDALEP
jgi:hypothetical protein